MIEVLAPSGNYLRAIAAFKGGADAVYLGGKSFSARMGADNFSDEEIEKIIDYAHSLHKKVYVTINTLLFQDEFMGAVAFAKQLYLFGVDALIVQDLGFAHYLHKVVPGLVLHASTQINCHNIEQAKALKELGFVRIVLAREAPLSFVKEVKRLGMEVEAFVHGALCVSYSGNCLLSSFIGNRSGNRGRCAQPCRMPYDMLEDGKAVQKDFYPISTKDLMTLDYVKEMIEAGVDSLKIEGRLKGEEYVYETSLAYSTMVHSILNDVPDVRLEEDKKALQDIYCRHFTKGFINDESPFSLLNQVSSSHQGERIGKVVKASKNRLTIQLEKDAHRLDGIRFNDKKQVGLVIEKMFVKSNPVESAKEGSLIDIPGVEDAFKFNGTEVIRTNNYVLNKSIEEKLKNKLVLPVSGTLCAFIGKPMELTVSFEGFEVTVIGDCPFAPINSGTSIDRIKEQLKKSSDYPYSISDLKYLGDNCFIQISSLNALRNAAYDALQKKIISSYKHDLPGFIYSETVVSSEISFMPKMIAESKAQQEFLNGKNYPCYMHGSSELNVSNRVEFTPRFTGKENILSFQAINFGQNKYIASTYCNITNSYAMDAYYHLGFDELILSSELDLSSIHDMVEDYHLRHGLYPCFGIVGYGKLDMMIMKSCPIGAFYHNKNIHCQRCHKKKFELVDKFNAHYHLLGDSECNIRLLSPAPIYLLDKENQLLKEHISLLYYLFTDESKEEINNILQGNKPKTLNRGHFTQRSL